MEKNTGKRLIRFFASIFILFGMVSCQAFFSTSLAPWAARTSYALPANMTAAQASDLLQTALAQNNPELASALLPQLLLAAQSGVPGEAQDLLLNDLYSATLLSSGIGTSISSLLPTVITALDPATVSGGGTSSDILMTALTSFQDSLSTVTLSTDELAALALYASDPPADADANTMIMTAAAVLIISADAADVDISADGLAAMTPEQITALVDVPGVDLALALALQAQAISDASGVPPIFELPLGAL